MITSCAIPLPKPHITVSIENPTRNNFAFLGWSTTQDGTVSYLPGATYSTDADVTLYAVWQWAYSLTIDPQDGTLSGATVQYANASGNIYLFNTNPEHPSKKTFVGYAETPDGLPQYFPGNLYPLTENKTIYAIYENPQELLLNQQGTTTFSFIYQYFWYKLPTGLDGNYYGLITSTINADLQIELYEKNKSGRLSYWKSSSGSNLINLNLTGLDRSTEYFLKITTGSSTLARNWVTKLSIFDSDPGYHWLTINPQGGTYSGSTTLVTDTNGQFTLPAISPAREVDRKNFVGFADIPSGQPKYFPGNTYTLTGNKTIYAVWEEPQAIALDIAGSVNFFFPSQRVWFKLPTGLEDTDRVWITSSINATFQVKQMSKYDWTEIFSLWPVNTNPYALPVYKHLTQSEDEQWFQISSNETDPTKAWITTFVLANSNQYSVSYFANGGEGAPEPQFKINGTTLTLSSVVPTRTGYDFKGWATTANATSANYQPSGNYTTNNSIALYAVWQAKTYTVMVSGGTGSAGSGNYAAGATVTITTGAPPAGKLFKQWDISPAVTYADGTSATSITAKFTMPAEAVTAIAVYEDDPAVLIAAAKTSKIAAINAIDDSLTETDYTPESWQALQTAIITAIEQVNAATTVEAVNAVVVPTTTGLVTKADELAAAKAAKICFPTGCLVLAFLLSCAEWTFSKRISSFRFAHALVIRFSFCPLPHTHHPIVIIYIQNVWRGVKSYSRHREKQLTVKDHKPLWVFSISYI